MGEEEREKLKQKVLKTLYETFPSCCKVVGGKIFLQDVVNESINELVKEK